MPRTLPKRPNPAPADKVAAFLESALVPLQGDHRAGTLDQAETFLREHPPIATANLFTACALGDAKTIGHLLSADPASARRPGGPRNWPPLLYLCYSRYLRLRKDREPAYVRAAALLIQHGADPNSLYVQDGFNETALYGAAGIANAPAVTRLLLRSGADPDDKQSPGLGSESLYHACEHQDNACLRLILKAGPRPENITHCIKRKLDFEDIDGARLMLNFGADANQGALLHAIRRRRSVAIIKLLINRGADVNREGNDGIAPIRLARRLGSSDVAECLIRHGAVEDANAREQFLAACAAGNPRGAKKFLRSAPALVKSLTADEMRVLPDAAAVGHMTAVRHMLDLGFDINAKGDWGGSAVQQAAGVGNVALVRLLIRRGADLRVTNDYGGDALGAAMFWTRHGEKGEGGMAVVQTIARAMDEKDLTRHLRRLEAEGDAELVDTLKKALKSRHKE